MLGGGAVDRSGPSHRHGIRNLLALPMYGEAEENDVQTERTDMPFLRRNTYHKDFI